MILFSNPNGLRSVFMRCAILCLILFATPVFAQPPDTLWSRSYGNGSDETVLTVRPIDGGGYIMCGNTDEGAGYMASWMMRTDNDGNEIWSSIDGGDLSNVAGHIEPASDGGFIYGGSTWSYSGNDSWDCTISRLDSSGTPEWQRALGSPDFDDYITNVAVVPSGGFIVIGTWVNEPFLWRVGSQGGTQWLTTHAQLAGSEFTFVDAFANGFAIAAESSDRFAVLHADEVGDFLWQYASDEDGRAECVRVLDGDTFACGYRILPNGWGRSWYVVRLDNMGNLVWEHMLDSATHESAEELWLSADGSLIVAGWGQSPDLTMMRWLFKYDLDGNLTWAYVLPGGQATTVAQDYYGNIVFSGTHGDQFLESTDFRLLKMTPEVLVQLLPHWETVPPGGGNMSFAGQITNSLAFPTALDLWAEVVTPDGMTVSMLDMLITLNPGHDITRTAESFYVPAGAPAGFYSYTLHVGSRSSGRHMGLASFEFYKVPEQP